MTSLLRREWEANVPAKWRETGDASWRVDRCRHGRPNRITRCIDARRCNKWFHRKYSIGS
ncbi:hypothetical protein A8H40_16110 [Burkholderia multivorans]|uniref:Uncharacterized protein n=2 Tax=Burkholderia multivorans TaxID=87883 RepID=B9BV13_9BURK|nr:hypothetical protein A8H40_16110 [Burkholderia multivorans]EEE05218.1 hypothetical protein BURMUCGD2_0405 [Burkholderia multivorans CGD2]EEE10957.1 hypothetical protein BURMUCGD2M_0401 [Burkholderia multivorans CGD2M]EJO51369.1 hypothetical protein BURMUCF1_0199 [Burkholderia multivorans ATCC BAA-247]PRD86040.1 hypothetical protein C6P76_15640 [Burkholderia multivorans]